MQTPPEHDDKHQKFLTRIEIIRTCLSCILSTLLASIFIRHPEPRDIVFCLFVAGVFLGFVELWSDLVE